MIVAPNGSELFTTTGEFNVDNMIAANSDNYINVSIASPENFSLSQAYPNPFNPTTSMTLNLNTDGQTSVKVFNVMGQLVNVLVNEYTLAGTYELTWNASQVPSGIYFIKTEFGKEISTQKVMLLK